MKDFTFEEIEKVQGIEYRYDEKVNGYLPHWYHENRKKSISDLSVADLCIAIRQNIFVEYLIPFVLKILENNILAGEMYDGELIASLKYISKKDWDKMSVERTKIIEMVRSNSKQLNGEIPVNIERLLMVLGAEKECR